ncbi:MAG: choice-of-anchor B family protein [Steroidobacteraceae bacterium]
MITLPRLCRLAAAAGVLAIGLPASSHHDDTVGARFVDSSGDNASSCLEHHEPCRSIQFALAQATPGNTVKVSAGIYDLSGVDPESFLFGVNHAQGGYEPGGHFDRQDPDANPTILVGVDARYRQAMMRLGFKWAADVASAQQGLVEDGPAAALQATAIAAADCLQGFAGQFPCHNVDFQAQISLNQFATQPVSAANVWGFVDQNDGREYAVVGLSDGTAIVEVTNPSNPRQVTTIPGNSSPWREVKIYQEFHEPTNRFRAFAFITTEAPNGGLQVIDLSGLPASASVATTLLDTGSQHTAYVSNIDYATNMALPGAEAFLYLAGSNVGNGAWRVYSLADPSEPQLIRQAPAGTQYVHDATSLLITDQRTTQCALGHNPCEVYVDFNENTVDLWDVTDKAAPVQLSSTGYSEASYTHSGWPTADQRHIFVHDETEEITRGQFTQIYTMNVDDLRNPFIVGSYQGPDTTTDHNGYTRGDLLYVSHYRRGLVVFDASDPEELRELGSFDTFLEPAANSAGTDGAWGVYPFFPSGTVVVSDISNGLFVLRDNAATLSQGAGRISFVGTTVSVSENTGTARVTLRRNAGFAGSVSIDFATTDGTATAGADYTTTSGTVDWTAGDLGDRTIEVPVVNDDLDEDGETFRITLTNAVGGATIEGSATLEVQITNDDGVAPPPGGGGGGGGGGASSAELLLLLGVLLAAARQRRV